MSAIVSSNKVHYFGMETLVKSYFKSLFISTYTNILQYVQLKS